MKEGEKEREKTETKMFLVGGKEGYASKMWRAAGLETQGNGDPIVLGSFCSRPKRVPVCESDGTKVK